MDQAAAESPLIDFQSRANSAMISSKTKSLKQSVRDTVQLPETLADGRRDSVNNPTKLEQLATVRRSMSDPRPYILFPGTAREALTFYGKVFGCSVDLYTFAQFKRSDGPPEAIAHGQLKEGSVVLFGADATDDRPSVRCEGLMLSLWGTKAASTMRDWFTKLSNGGRVMDDLQMRPWGDFDGQVIDRYGVHWLIGFEADS